MKKLTDIKIRQSQNHQEHLTISVALYSIYLLYDMDFNIYIGVSISNVEKIDVKITVLFRLTTSAGTETDICAVYAPSDIDSPTFFKKL